MTHPDEPSLLTGPSGEARLRQHERRIRAVKAGLFLTGLLAGLITGVLVGETGFAPDARWPAPLAIGLVATFLVAMALGGLLLHRLYDEVERQIQYKAVAGAALVYAIGYPVWFVLWKGGFVPEPSHWTLFLAFYTALAGSYLFYRVR